MIKQAIILFAMIQACGDIKNDPARMRIEYDTLSLIPPATGKNIQFGLAGALVGCSGNQLIVAGGSNFEDNLPWKGGTKSYHDAIYILTHQKDGSYIWLQPDQKLPRSMAYSANLSTPKGFISIGGEDLNGKLDQVFHIFMEGDSVRFNMLPSLPLGLSNAGVVSVGSKIFVVGGLDKDGASNRLLSFDLSAEKGKWIDLSNLPEALSHAVVVSQNDGREDCIYVFGGRNKTSVVTTFYSAIWKYSPTLNQWYQIGELHLDGQPAFGLSAGTGIAYGDRWIILIGGDKGIIFNQTEKINDKLSKIPEGAERVAILKEKDELLSNHPGFSRDILSFDTHTCKLQKIGEVPAFSQVTTSAFWWDNRVVIPSGEIRPGVRTPVISSMRLILKKGIIIFYNTTHKCKQS